MGKAESKLMKYRKSSKLPGVVSAPAMTGLPIGIVAHSDGAGVKPSKVPSSLETAKDKIKDLQLNNFRPRPSDLNGSDKSVTPHLPDEMLETCELILRIGSLVHQLQKERGMSAIVTGNSGEEMAHTLEIVRLQADKSLEELMQFVKDTEFYETARESVGKQLTGQVSKLRDQINTRTIAFRQVVHEFSDLVSHLFVVVDDRLRSLKDYKVGPAASTYSAFLHLKEAVGVERALVGGLLSAGDNYTEASFSDLVFNAGEQKAYGVAFRTTANVEVMRLYNDICDQSEELQQITDKLAVFKMGGRSESMSSVLPGLTSEKWFEMMTSKIDKLEKIEVQLANDILNYSAQPISMSHALVMEGSDDKMIIQVGNQSFNLMKMGLTPDYLIDVRELNVVREIGRGTTGSTYLATWRHSEVAVKVVQCTKEGKEAELLMRDFAREIAVLTKARHPNICQFLGCALDPPTYCVVLEYMEGGSLFDLYRSYKHIDFFPLAMGIARGMDYIHSHLQMNHRDLKSPNLLLDATNKTVKIADFGLSCLEAEAGVKTAEIGTYRWMAPEVILHEPYGYSADVYGYACVLSEMLTREMPFAGTAPMQVALQVSEGGRPRLPSATPEPIKKFISLCWAQKPENRPTFQEILNHLERLQDSLTPKEQDALKNLGLRKQRKSNSSLLS